MTPGGITATIAVGMTHGDTLSMATMDIVFQSIHTDILEVIQAQQAIGMDVVEALEVTIQHIMDRCIVLMLNVRLAI